MAYGLLTKKERQKEEANHRRIKKEYNENFEQMVIAHRNKDEKNHIKFVKRENELNHQQIVSQKKLGIYVSNPCPAGSVIDCNDCKGFYRKNPEYKKGNNKKIIIRCKQSDKGAKECFLRIKK